MFGIHTDSYIYLTHNKWTKLFFFSCGNSLLKSVQSNKSSQPAIRGQLSDVYLPSITGPMSNLQAAKARLSHSCPYLSTSRRRGSTSSINSQRAPDFNSKQASRLWLCWQITLQLWTSLKCWVISFSWSLWLTGSMPRKKIVSEHLQCHIC